jgi:uncharacterized damage-inducible protein DinB
MRSADAVTVPFPEPTTPVASRAGVFLGYLDYFRARLITKLRSLPPTELRTSRLPSGWTPLELIKHLRYVELRWLDWGFEGTPVADPWGDEREGRWHVADDETLPELATALASQAARTRQIVESHDLADSGRPGDRWEGAEPASLERVLFHVMQEYARHLGQLDVVSELARGRGRRVAGPTDARHKGQLARTRREEAANAPARERENRTVVGVRVGRTSHITRKIQPNSYNRPVRSSDSYNLAGVRGGFGC